MTAAREAGVRRLLEECTAIAQELGLPVFSEVARCYSDLLGATRPRLLVLATSSHTGVDSPLTRVREGLRDWEVVVLPYLAEAVAPTILADAGLVVSRVNAPLRAEEAELVSRHWRRALDWHALLDRGDEVDEEDWDEVTQFARSGFQRLTGGRRTLATVAPSAAVCAQGLLAAASPAARAGRIVRELHDLMGDLLGKLRARETAIEAARTDLAREAAERRSRAEAACRVIETAHTEARTALPSLAGRIQSRLTSETGETRDQVLRFIRVASLDTVRQEIGPMLEASVRDLADSLGRDADRQIEQTIEATLAKLEPLLGAEGTGMDLTESVDGVSTLLRRGFEGMPELSPKQRVSGALRNVMGGASVGLLAGHAGLLAPFALPLALVGAVLFHGSQKEAEEERTRAILAQRAGEFLRENQNRIAADLHSALTARTGEVLARLDDVCRTARDAVRATADGAEVPVLDAERSAIRARLARVSALAEQIRQEIERQELVALLEKSNVALEPVL